jgi:CHAT domain-containing protein
LEHSNGEALDLYLRAIAALDAQVGRLGGSNLDRARLRGRHADAYRGAIRLLVAKGDAEAAYAVLERSRARTLLDLLAERDLEPPTELPLELREERARIEGDLARLQTEAESPAAERGGGALDVWVAKRRRLLGERSALVERLRRASPRYAALTAPEPLGLDAARRTLDADTLGLTYSVGERETILFVLFPQGFRGAPRSGLEAIRLGVGRDGNEGSDGNDANVGLAAEVAAFRSLLLARQGLENPTFRRLAESLSQKLLGPAAHHLPAAQRLAISPDGPLSLLPFAALVIPTTHDSKPTSDPAYLASRFAHYTIASATLAEELRRRAADRASHRKEEVWPLVAFGDPNDRARVESATPNRGTASRAWSRSQLNLPPLPASAREVRSIGALFDRTTLRLGHNATEAEFLAVAPHGTRVHFAGHALLDSRFPLESALALAPPAARSRPDDDGLLQAWEIFERLRLSADLVALSACDTALGQEAGGEGLLGLTRAFHFAGARTVLASLWSVLDRSSSELMTAFYRRLAAGEEADDALAAAQREMLSGPNRAPFHWAAFELDGNPRGIAEPKNSNPR